MALEGGIGGNRPNRSDDGSSASLRTIAERLKDLLSVAQGFEKRDKQEATATEGKGVAKSIGEAIKSSEVKKEGAAGMVGGLVKGLGEFLKPRQTSTERAYSAAQSAATEFSANYAIGIARSLGADTAGQMRAGDAAATLVSGVMEQAFHRDRTIGAEMRGGYGDLRQMAMAGIEVSDEMMARRTAALEERAERGYDFDTRMVDYIGKAVNPLGNQVEAQIRESMESAKEEFAESVREMKDEVKRAAADLRASNDQNSRIDRAW